MKIAICDDSRDHSSTLEKILASYHKTKDAEISIYSDPQDMVADITKGKQYEVAFLDIDMPGMNGIELGKVVKENSKSTFIVIVTSYPQYAINAYDCEAFHYLLKPIELEKLMAVVDKILIKYKELHKYHVIKIKTEQIRIPIKDLYYVECCKKHIIYHLKNKRYETIETLTDVYEALKDYGFYQVH